MSDIHFEHIWNYAETVAAQFSEETLDNNILSIKKEVDKIQTMDKLPNKQGEIIGEILFELCAITHKLGINSAAALRLATENRKAKLYDPEEE